MYNEKEILPKKASTFVIKLLLILKELIIIRNTPTLMAVALGINLNT